MRALALVAALGVAGCLTPPDLPPSADDKHPAPVLLGFPWWTGHQMVEGGSAPEAKQYAYPMANAFVNEDVEVFSTSPWPAGFVAHNVSLRVKYGVDRATGYPTTGQARHFVFWVGSGGVYNMYDEVLGPATLQPGTVYSAQVDFEVPPGGWHMPSGEPLQVLIAPLVANTGGQTENLHYLLGGDDPTRLEVLATPWDGDATATIESTSETVKVAGNSGLFTGAVPASQANTVRRTVTLRAEDAFLDIDVRFTSTKGGKSDLDMELQNAKGEPVAASTTPYQSERIRLHRAGLEALGPGGFTIHINAYSGLDTEFQLVITRATVSSA